LIKILILLTQKKEELKQKKEELRGELIQTRETLTCQIQYLETIKDQTIKPKPLECYVYYPETKTKIKNYDIKRILEILDKMQKEILGFDIESEYHKVCEKGSGYDSKKRKMMQES
jgi:hypothetical protein